MKSPSQKKLKTISITEVDKPKKKKIKLDDVEIKVKKKKPKVVDGEVVERKKKAKVSKADKERQKEYVLALANEKPKQRISKTNTGKLRSILGDASESIQQLLEVNDTDNARSMIYKKMLQSLVDIIPYAENNIRKTKGVRGVYQLNSLIASIRELLIDVQSSQDRGRMGELLVQKIIAPAFLDLGMAIMSKFELITNDAKSRMTNEEWRALKEQIVKHRNDLSQSIERQYHEINDQVKDYLQR